MPHHWANLQQPKHGKHASWRPAWETLSDMVPVEPDPKERQSESIWSNLKGMYGTACRTAAFLGIWTLARLIEDIWTVHLPVNSSLASLFTYFQCLVHRMQLSRHWYSMTLWAWLLEFWFASITVKVEDDILTLIIDYCPLYNRGLSLVGLRQFYGWHCWHSLYFFPYFTHLLMQLIAPFAVV